MGDTTTTTEPTTTTTAEPAGGATQTGQGMFVQPTAQPAAPTPADIAAKTTTAKAADPAAGKTTEPAEPDDEGEKGKGSKDAVLADLARERDERQKAQTQLDAVLTALGLKETDPTTVDPQQLAADLHAQRAENVVLRTGHGIADVEGLLDSKRFTDSLSKVDVTDSAAVKAHIEAFVNEHPRYAANGSGVTTPGVRDAAAAPTTASTETDWLRAAIRR